MANNRLYLVCSRCKTESKPDYSIAIAKYYPSTEWYPIALDSSRYRKFETFLKAHTHEPRGLRIVLEREDDCIDDKLYDFVNDG